MKRGVEWLAIMPYKYQVLFLKRLSETPAAYSFATEPRIISFYLNMKFESFYSFMANSFNWEETPEGRNWWSELAFYQKYK
jgi:hypothetical protein